MVKCRIVAIGYCALLSSPFFLKVKADNIILQIHWYLHCSLYWPLPVLHLIYLNTSPCLALNLFDGHMTDWEIQLLADVLFWLHSLINLNSPWFEWKAPHLLTHLFCIKHSPAVDHGFGLGVVPPTLCKWNSRFVVTYRALKTAGHSLKHSSVTIYTTQTLKLAIGQLSMRVDFTVLWYPWL